MSGAERLCASWDELTGCRQLLLSARFTATLVLASDALQRRSSRNSAQRTLISFLGFSCERGCGLWPLRPRHPQLLSPCLAKCEGPVPARGAGRWGLKRRGAVASRAQASLRRPEQRV